MSDPRPGSLQPRKERYAREKTPEELIELRQQAARDIATGTSIREWEEAYSMAYVVNGAIGLQVQSAETAEEIMPYLSSDDELLREYAFRHLTEVRRG